MIKSNENFNIGGPFEYQKDYCNSEFQGQFKVLDNFSVNGRSALYDILNEIIDKNVRKIYLPVFCCSSIIECVKKSKLEIIYYKLNSKLNPLVNPKKNTSILVINYFGRISKFVEKYKKSKSKKYILIEDATHSFLNIDFDPFDSSHYIYFSLRKHSHISAGGWSNASSQSKKKYTDNQMLISDIKLFRKKKKNFLNQNKYRENEDCFVNFFRKKEIELSKIYSSDSLSKNLKNEICKYNWMDVSKKRRNNWLLLDSLLGKKFKKIFKYLKKNEVPLGYIIIVKERNKLRNYLKKRRIYSSIHWPIYRNIKKANFKFEVDLSNHILTIPIDQRYSKNEIKYIADNIINSGIK